MNKQIFCILLLALLCLSAAQNLRNLQTDGNETKTEKKICNPVTGECCIPSESDCSCWFYLLVDNEFKAFYMCDD
ncbi:hypothetical protein TTHERM_000422226 (macronuclear) [Tetrahymena thermophila SB210]|uniref:Transmembrane protein n=1 Tax=Tetrahymena thermophila (strain SB210) TaxID=312017 RepID=W7XKJ1_TETTS|nr:hypothetical protein TTHERM_000422226 [Tetrahymena thermophila SB210]EWS74949.1 hypothetical protein TTHERM_000422226 [Tetrahymena thermophila SB210]|eukprot:XP_012652490.1 hypothetical protein TTHERM_000422226 [Tetrahymena thermophila SB210]